MTGMECSRLYDLAPELALGLLDGAERAEALAHLERCARCHADVASLTELGEQLLLLAPEVPPPAGFETRVLDRVHVPEADIAPVQRPRGGRRGRRHAGPDRRDHRWSFRTRAALVAAVVLVVAAVGVVVTLPGEDEPVVAASVPMDTDDGRTIGTADLLEGSPPVVRLDLADWMDEVEGWDDPPTGPWRLMVVDDAGQVESYDLADDVATRDVRLDEGDASSVHHVSLVDGSGHVWCTGRFED